MARQCNDCERPADVNLWYLKPGDEKNFHTIIACCADCAIKLHRKPRNNPRCGFYLRESMEQEQVMRELIK